MAALKQLRRMEAQAVVADGASDALAAIAKRAGEMGQAMQGAGQAVEQTDRKVSQSKTAFERTRDSVDKLGAAARQLAREKERINAAFDGGKISDPIDTAKFLAGNAAMAERNRLLALAEQKYQDVAKRAAAARAAESAPAARSTGALASSSANDNRALAAANDNLSRSFGGVAAAASSALSAMGPMGSTVAGIGRAATGSAAGMAALTAAIAALSISAVKAVQDQERLIGVFTQATGDAGKAGQEYAFVRAEADRLGLAFGETATQYAKLAAASRGTALEGQDTRNIFIGVAEAAAALKLNAEQTGGALTAVEQIISKGKVQAEELRGQLGERLPGAFQIAARAMGVTTQELDAMLQKGAVMADDFLPKFAAELHKTFGDQASRNADGLTASFNRLDTAANDLKRAVGEGGLSAAVGDVAKQLTAVAKESNGAAGSLGSTLASGVRAAGDAARYLYQHADMVKSALVGLVAAKAAATFLELATAIQAAGGAMAVLNAVMAANPYALAAIAVGALAAGLYEVYQRSKEAEEAQRQLAAATDDVKRINALSTEEINNQSTELRANTVEAAKNAEAKLAMADAEAQMAALRARSRLDETEAQNSRYLAQGPGRFLGPAEQDRLVYERRSVSETAAAAARARQALNDAQDALARFNGTATKTAPAVNAAALAANRNAQILGDYKDTVKGLYPLEDALAERNKKRASIMVALDAGVTTFTQAQKDLAAVDKDYKDQVESITHADRDRKKAADEASKEAEQQQQQREKAIDTVEGQIATLKDEAAQLSMTERERFVHNAALKAEKSLRDGLVDGADDYIDRVKREAGALYDKKAAQDAATEAQEKAKKASETAAKEQAKTAEKATDDITRYAGDVFADLFANTKGGWAEVWADMLQTARATLARIAAEMLLRPIIAPVVQSVVGSMASAAGGQAAAASGSSGGMGNLLSLGSKLIPSSWTSGITSAIDTWGATTLGIGTASAMPSTVVMASGGAGGVGSGMLAGGGATSIIPGEVAAGTGLTSYLGPVGLGFGAGMLLPSMFGVKNKAAGALVGAAGGAAAGALTGTFLFPGVGTLLGAILGGASGGLGGLLGTQKPSVGKTASADVIVSGDGKSASYNNVQTDNEGDPQVGQQLGQAVAAILTAAASGGGRLAKSIGIGQTAKDGVYVAGSLPYKSFGDDIAAALRYALLEQGGLKDAGPNVIAALKNSKAKDWDEAAKDIALGAGVDAGITALKDLDKSLAGLTRSAKEATAESLKPMLDELARAKALGIGDAYTQLASDQLKSYLETLRNPVDWTQGEQDMANLKGQFAAIREAVGQLNPSLSTTVDEIEKETKARIAAQVQNDANRRLNTALNREYINQINDLAAARDVEARNLAAVGLSTRRATEIFDASLGNLLSGLDALQLDVVAASFTGSIRDLATSMRETSAAAIQARQALAAYQADINGRAYAAVGADRSAGLIALDAQQAKALADARAAGYDTTQLQQVQAAERAAQAFALAQQDVLGALDRQIAAQQDYVTSLQDGAVKIAQTARQFRAANDNLALNDNSPLSPAAKLTEARWQFEAAFAKVKDTAANDNDREAARQTLLSLGPTLIEIAKQNFATADSTDYQRVRAVYAELGDLTAQGVDTSERQLATANNTLAELQRQRSEAAAIGQRQYGALSGLREVMDRSYAVWQAQLTALQATLGVTSGTSSTSLVDRSVEAKRARLTAFTNADIEANFGSFSDIQAARAANSNFNLAGWFRDFGINEVLSGTRQIPGFASGGVSYGPQLAWVSEGAWPAEAHVPLPDGRSIPVTMRMELPQANTDHQQGDDWRALIDGLVVLLRTLQRDSDLAGRQRDAIGNAVADRLDTAIGLLDDIEAAIRRKAA